MLIQDFSPDSNLFSGLTLMQLALGGLPSIDLLLNRQTRSETRSQHKYSQQFFSYIFPPDLVHVLLGRVLVASVPRGDVITLKTFSINSRLN